jgi:muconolactone D-isomerase
VIEFLTHATVTRPEGLTASEVDDLIRREAERAAELAREGRLVRAWRPHASQEWANICLWKAQDESDLRAQLESLPFFPHMTVSVQQLDTHPSDPQGPEQDQVWRT